MTDPNPSPPPATLALLRAPATTLATDCELTHVARRPIDVARIAAEHAAYAQALRDAGLQVTVLAGEPALPDSVFVEDAALVLDELAVLTRPGAASRRAEPALLADALAALRPGLARIEAPGTLDGGDVLRIGRELWVGLTTRTNAGGIAQLAAITAPFGYRVQGVPLGPSLHLKTACTALDDETLLANPAWVDTAALGGRRIIAVDPDEPFAANVLRLDGAWVVNAAFPRTRARIEAHARATGVRVHAVELMEFGKAEAGLTCLSLVFRR